MTHWIRNLCLSMVVLIAALLPAAPAGAARIAQGATETPVFVYFFWGDGCPHCAAAKPFLEDLTRRYPQVQVESFEVYQNADNQVLFKAMAAAHGFEPRYVPTIFIGEKRWEGFADAMRREIETAVQACVEAGCPDAGAGVVPGHDVIPEAPISPEICKPEASTCDDPEGSVDVAPRLEATLFYGDVGCAQCDATKDNHITQSGFLQIGDDSGIEALRLLRKLEAEHSGFKVTAYEVWIDATNAGRFNQMAESQPVEATGVPTLFIGERVWQGFDAQTAAEVEAYVEACLTGGCPGALDETDPEPAAALPGASQEDEVSPAPPELSMTIPLLGTVNLGKQSLWASTALISFADGFNPCSLWVLSILIALTLRTGSRKRVFTIGIIYITVTAGIYVLFIAGLFTFLTVVSFLNWIQTAVSLLALFFAAINIKDYFWYKEGLSFTIADEKKPGIYKRIRKVLNAGDSFWTLAGATVALGVGVSLVEFSCTAGFPVIWTNLVSAQGVAPLTFVLLLLLYMLIYQIDELIIFGIAVLTLKTSRLEEKHGRILKLIGGTMMLTLAAVMLISPSLMAELGTSLLIFGVAIGLALLVLVVHRRLLPRFGIRIGTEMTAPQE